MKGLVYSLLISLALYTQAAAQNNPMAQAFGQSDFVKCIDLCEDELAVNPENAQAWFFKGSSLVSLEKYEKGKSALNNAITNNFANTNAVEARILQADAGLRNTDAVITRLDRLAGQGFGAIQLFANKEFEYLKNKDDFNLLIKRIDINANPCKHKPEHQRLDFWLGTWDVFVGGNKTAVSYITKSEGGCTLHEDYRTNGGFFGTSYNYFDPQDSLYKQIWIDKFNGITNFREVDHGEGKLIMQATRPNGNLARMSYQWDAADQSVTQTMEASTDQGQSWTSNFVGVYRKQVVDAKEKK